MELFGNLNHGSSGFPLNGKIMFSAVIILFFAVVLILCFHTYARWLFRRQNRRIRRRIRAHLRSLSAAQDPTISSSLKPLDPNLLEKIPIVIFSSKNPNFPPPAEECAVCLTEFEENDEGRVLPKCRHVFHVECIDTWFKSRSSCPLCRTPVQPDNNKIEITEPVIQSIKPIEDIEIGSSSESSSPSSSSSSPVRFPMEACEREPIDLLGIIVEMPREFDNRNSGLPGETGSKLTGNRAVLKRLWSI